MKCIFSKNWPFRYYFSGTDNFVERVKNLIVLHFKIFTLLGITIKVKVL